MALTVGTDSYISQADATLYVAANYATTSAEYIAWAALTSDNKDAYLRRACKVIDRQMFVGIKAVQNQTLEFPRAIATDYKGYSILPSGYTSYSADYVVQTVVPDAVKYAQVEEAISLAAGMPKRIELQRQGVKSFSLGNLSESYGGAVRKLASYEAMELLRPYLAGSAPII